MQMDRVNFQSCQTSLWHQSQRFNLKKKKKASITLLGDEHICNDSERFTATATVAIQRSSATIKPILSEESRMSYRLTMPRLTFTVENHNHPLLQTIPVELLPQLIRPIQSHDTHIKKEEQAAKSNHSLSSKGLHIEQLGRHQQVLRFNKNQVEKGQESIM